VADLPPAKDGEPGRSVDPAEVQSLLSGLVQKAVAEIPKPRDGQSLTVADVAPLIAAEVEKSVKALPVPKDGIGVLGALLDRQGHLVVTLSDGSVKDLGSVVGRDMDMADVERHIGDVIAKWPRPKDGVNGVNGKDGFGFDDLSVLHDGERGFTFQFTRGAEVKSFAFTIPCLIYKGVYAEGTTYDVGDSVTFGGNIFTAKATTTQKPDFTPAAVKAWTLSVKAGRDGRTPSK
jgi:hypothetical protein